MIHMQDVVSGRQLRQAFACFPSGVTAICALVDRTPIGMAASSFTSVSVDPPLVSVCIQKTVFAICDTTSATSASALVAAGIDQPIHSVGVGT